MNQLFNSFPALSDAASYLAQTTAYLGECFSNSDPDDVSDDLSQSSSTFSASYVPEHCSAALEHSATRTTPSLDEEMQPVPESSGTIHGHADPAKPREQKAISFFQSIVSRARTTIRGSAGDIGWLQRRGKPTKDKTKRFLILLDGVRKGEHKLPNGLVYLLVPGLFSNHGPLYFASIKATFSKMGLTCHIARIHSEASVEKNARELKEYIEEIHWGSKKRILILGHSKGGVDATAAAAMYWPDLKDKIAGIALAQSPYGGSPIASDILREGQLGDYVGLRQMLEILICKVIKGEMQALEDLTYERRKEFLIKYQLPEELPIISFHTEAGVSPRIFSTLSHVAHAELPVVSNLNGNQATKVPVVMPLAAAMAACAHLLEARYGEKSDGLVTCRDAEVPGSVVIHPARKLDHAWMVYSSLNDDSGEANPAEVCEALFALLVEVGQERRREKAMKDD